MDNPTQDTANIVHMVVGGDLSDPVKRSTLLRFCLEALRWEPSTLADVLAVPPGFANGMLDGRVEIPERMMVFLHRAAAAVSGLSFASGEPGQMTPVPSYFPEAVRQASLLTLVNTTGGVAHVHLNPDSALVRSQSAIRAYPQETAMLPVSMVTQPGPSGSQRTPPAHARELNGNDAKRLLASLAFAYDQPSSDGDAAELTMEARYAIFAQALCVDPKLVQRWVEGKRAIPEGIMKFVRGIEQVKAEASEADADNVGHFIPNVFDFVTVDEYIGYRDTYRFAGRNGSKRRLEARNSENYYPPGVFGANVKLADEISARSQAPAPEAEDKVETQEAA